MRTIHPDIRILEIAARQHGVASREQLRQAGLSRGAIAVLTHRTAAGILRIIPDVPRERPIDVSGPRSLRGPRSGVRLHRVGRLPSDEVCQRHGLAVAIAPRTILDLAAILGPYDLERALAQAERQEVVTLERVRAIADRYPGRPGRGKLLALLDDIVEPALTRSPPELLLLKRLRRAGVPRPRTNVRVAGMEIDMLFADYAVAVEIDGYTFHRQRPVYESDRSRGAALAAQGITLLRFTPRQLAREPDKVLARLCLALGARRRKD